MSERRVYDTEIDSFIKELMSEYPSIFTRVKKTSEYVWNYMASSYEREVSWRLYSHDNTKRFKVLLDTHKKRMFVGEMPMRNRMTASNVFVNKITKDKVKEFIKENAFKREGFINAIADMYQIC